VAGRHGDHRSGRTAEGAKKTYRSVPPRFLLASNLVIWNAAIYCTQVVQDIVVVG
jgi:hypothetical protein